MIICHCTSVHDWNDVRIYVKMSRSAVMAGWHVRLVAPVTSGNPLANSGHVSVHALRKYQSRLLRATLGTVRAIGAAMRIRADLYHVHDPELLPLVLTLRVLGRRVIFDFHEEFSAQIRSKPYVGRGLRTVAALAARCWELLLCCAASGIVAATPRIRERLPVGKDRSAIVCNYPTLDEFPSPASKAFDERPRVAYYVGGVTAARGCYEMIEAGRILAESGSGIRIRIAGPFDSETSERSLRSAASGSATCFLGRRTRAQVPEDLAAARVGIVVLRRTPNHLNSLPVKMFEYMAAGLPVVASDFPLWNDIVRGSGCGVTVDARDPSKIAAAIAAVVEDTVGARRMGERGRRAVETTYHWTTQWDRLRSLYETVVQGRTRRRASYSQAARERRRSRE